MGAAHAAPQEAVALALADARGIGDRDTLYYTRYLDGTHLSPADLALYSRMDTLQVQLLSRSPRKYAPRPVAGGRLLAVDLRYMAENKNDYARVFEVWERFVSREPYYHVTKDYTPQGGTKGRWVFQADFLRKDQTEELYRLTSSRVPVVTMDWFFAMTAVEADRGGIGRGFGYYDFLGIKNRDDYFKLAGVDLKNGRSEQSELLAVVLGHNSGVAQNDRMVVRRAATDGFLWFTLDFFDNNLDERNPLLFLDPKKGLKHQAERHFATLPNGLPVVIACDANGVLQESAPDKIGPDTSARGKDQRIHPSKSCLSCHSNGWLKDIDDEVRQIYKFEPNKGYNLLSSPEKEEEQRLHAAYLRDFNAKLSLDRLAYELAIREAVGLDVKTAAQEYKEAYHKYVTDALSLQQVADGLGVSVEDFQAKLKTYRGSVQSGTGDQLASHILAPLSLSPPRPVTRGNYEQMYNLLQQLSRGVPKP